MSLMADPKVSRHPYRCGTPMNFTLIGICTVLYFLPCSECIPLVIKKGESREGYGFVTWVSAFFCIYSITS